MFEEAGVGFADHVFDIWIIAKSKKLVLQAEIEMGNHSSISREGIHS
jgi:hypothetical protein